MCVCQPFVCIKPGYAMINKNKRLQALRLEEPIKSFRGFNKYQVEDNKKIEHIPKLNYLVIS